MAISVEVGDRVVDVSLQFIAIWMQMLAYIDEDVKLS